MGKVEDEATDGKEDEVGGYQDKTVGVGGGSIGFSHGLIIDIGGSEINYDHLVRLRETRGLTALG